MLNSDFLEQTLAKVGPNGRARFMERIRSMKYPRFLKSGYWYSVRQAIESRRSTDRCERCFRPIRNYQLHHQTYIHHGEEHRHLNELRVLCGTCHISIHEERRLMENAIGAELANELFNKAKVL